MPDIALYYPEWSIREPLFLAESLLYWDRLTCLVPFKGERHTPEHEDREVGSKLQEAHERYVTWAPPSEEQKRRAGKRLEALASLDPPEWCRAENLAPEHRQIFSAYKFPDVTVQALQERGWIRPLHRAGNEGLQLVADAMANVLLGVLVRECSSPSMPPITDDPGSFQASCNTLLAELGSPVGITSDPGHVRVAEDSSNSDFSLLMARIPHLGFAAETSPLHVLTKVLEARNNDEINHQRVAFRSRVDTYLERLRSAEGPQREAIADQFRDELNVDLNRLKRDLQRIGLNVLIDKEGVVAVILRGLMGVVRFGFGTLLGLGEGLLDYHRKREQAFEKHWSSWVFSVAAPRLSIW